MDPTRFGRGIRALRQRRRWRQADVAAAAGVSRSVIWRVERGRAARVSVATLERIAEALGARVVLRLDWGGQDLDRLLDGDHAALVDAVVGSLVAGGWSCLTEVTFSVYGERGSIDILAWHAATRSLLVIEVKTVVPDVGPMIATLDRKTRLAPGIVRDRGWIPASVSRLLVVRDGPTVRRHVAKLDSTFRSGFPERNVAVRRWLARPDGAISGLWFFSIARHTSGKSRIRPAGRVRERAAGAGSSQMRPEASERKRSLG
ncbi:MAG TPA: helix-turn-helix transcriptional regulator [Vitreimonas sp.]|nr:helix-turn-helix transcriptional regulator [Vitreimonas sp.]